jgi:hypothetical protein
MPAGPPGVRVEMKMATGTSTYFKAAETEHTQKLVFQNAKLFQKCSVVDPDPH